MSDKYGVGQDPYCYPGTDVLRNRLNIHDEALLSEAERELYELAAASNITLAPPPYDLPFLQHIHHVLFSDIYDVGWPIQDGIALTKKPPRRAAFS